MKNIRMQYSAGLLSIVFGLCVYLFFALCYPFHLHYQEEMQLFLFTKSYWLTSISKPGGLSEYIASFLTQFNYYSWIGAIIHAVLLVAIQLSVFGICNSIRKNTSLYAITFLPSFFYWVLLCDENMMPCGVVSLLITLVLLYGYTKIKQVKIRLTYALLMLPITYAVAGGTFLIFGIACIAIELFRKELLTKQWLCLASAIVIITCLLPYLTKSILLPQYPLRRLWWGGDFYRFVTLYPNAIWILWGITLIVILGYKFLPSHNEKPRMEWLQFTVLSLAIAIIGGYAIYANQNAEKEDVMAYDYYIRTQQWQRAIRRADRHAPSSPLSVASLNLALCKENMLGERMFHYYQNGPEGLLPSFARDYTIPLMAGEIYYHLGFINTAQRYVFEAMESLPDYRKSARAIKRLAETNIINEEYDVAQKYLHILQHTLYYADWATETEMIINDKTKRDVVPEWVELRRHRTKKDFLFSEKEKDMMLGILLEQDFSNRMAYEYLISYCLLTKDLQSFIKYYSLGEQINYPVIPRHFQEALIYIWNATNKDATRTIPYPISDEVIAQMKAFQQTYKTNIGSEVVLKKDFGSTYWYYLLFRK